MSEWILFIPRGQLNEATRYYIDTIVHAARALGWEPRQVDSLRGIPWRANVLVVECKSAFKLRITRPFAHYWLWMQGVVPEEARMQFGSRWRETLWTFFERIALPKARGILMVSQAMHCHYARKYGLTNLPVFIMPCVNADLQPAHFSTPGKYLGPNFVYVGSMHAWQCFQLTLEVFARVKLRLPLATLTVLTGDKSTAHRTIDAARVTGVKVGFVPLTELPSVLANYKYGFVLRAAHVVNSVATPTKVSSYMASGVIPVMTSAVDDYVEKLADVDPIVICRAYDADSIAQEILAVEARLLEPAAVLNSYSGIFTRYFDHANYGAPLTRFLRATGLQSVKGHDVA